MKKRLLNIAVALGLVSGLFVGAIAPAGALGPEEPATTIYFPWVPNDDTIAGIEGITGSVTIQNLETYPIEVTVTAYDGDSETITLNPRASQTFSAADLGIPEGSGSGVVASAEWWDVDPDVLFQIGICERASDGAATLYRGSPENTVDGSVQLDFPPQMVTVVQNGFTYTEGTDYTWDWTYNPSDSSFYLSINWSPDGAEPSVGSPYYVYVYGFCNPPRIAGVEKHTVGTVGVQTNANTEMVDGYSAIPSMDVDMAEYGGVTLEWQSRWVLPIVQTNNGWNTEIVITNIWDEPTAVNATFYAAGGQGVAGPGLTLLSGQFLAPGKSVRVDLTEDAGFPEGAVGSVWIDATHAVVATAFRHKAETGMMLTTNAQPRTDSIGILSLANGLYIDPLEKFGPLVFRDYNGWNTGINIANLSSENNRVTVTYYNYAGNVVASEAVTIPPRAMEYVYTPATGNFGLGENQVTAVRIGGEHPLVAAIDEVKYLGGQGEGHAMSYPAASVLEGDLSSEELPFTIYGRWFYPSMLALPLVQKGNPLTGTGDTSGINLFNADAAHAVEAYLQFVDPAGVPVAPTVGPDDSEDPIKLPLGPHAGATVYTLTYSEMSPGFQGAVVVGIVGDGALVGVSNNVNYDVAFDGSAVFNLVGVYSFYDVMTIQPQ